MGRKKKKKWFKPTGNLKGWKANQKKSTRLRHATQSAKARGRGKVTRKSLVSTARALQAVSNVTQDKKTKQAARADARAMFRRAKQMK